MAPARLWPAPPAGVIRGPPSRRPWSGPARPPIRSSGRRGRTLSTRRDERRTVRRNVGAQRISDDAAVRAAPPDTCQCGTRSCGRRPARGRTDAEAQRACDAHEKRLQDVLGESGAEIAHQCVKVLCATQRRACAAPTDSTPPAGEYVRHPVLLLPRLPSHGPRPVRCSPRRSASMSSASPAPRTPRDRAMVHVVHTVQGASRLAHSSTKMAARLERLRAQLAAAPSAPTAIAPEDGAATRERERERESREKGR